MAQTEASISETVIIPHPTENAKLSKLQKELCAAFLLAPVLPLYVRLEENSQETVQKAKSLKCTLTAPCYDAESKSVYCPAEIIAGDGKDSAKTSACSGRLLLSRALEGLSKPIAADNEIAATGGMESLFPLRLPVVRIAEVKFTGNENSMQWEVEKARWVKSGAR